MVARLNTAQKIDVELQSLRLMLDDLPGVAAEWEQLADGERVGWSLDWDQLMGVLTTVLEPCYRTGEMTSGQRTRYEAILRNLRETLPTIRRVKLCTPNVPLEC